MWLVSRLQAGWPRKLGSIAGRDKWFFSSMKHPERLWGPSSFLFNGCGLGGGIYHQWVRATVSEVYYLPLFSKLTMIGAVPSLHLTRMPSLSALEQLYLWWPLIVSVLRGHCRNYKRFAVWNETVKITETLLHVSPFGKLIVGYVPYCVH